MRAIRARGNRSTEWRLRALLVGASLKGWTIRPLSEIGSPDFAFAGAKVAVFVDGCFWHGCPRCGHVPKTNVPYWAAKIARNRARDRKMSRVARMRSYRVVRIWECELKRRAAEFLERIRRAVKQRVHSGGRRHVG
jgi:DNA mismatch endonuclease (patch repair protein)